MSANLGQLRAEIGVDGLSGALNNLRQFEEGTKRVETASQRMARENDVAMQRMIAMSRSLGAAIGVVGFGAMAREAVQAALAMQRIEQQMKLVTGSSSLGGREIQWLRSEVNRLGLEFQGTAESYAKFAFATKGTSIEGEKTRRTFIGLMEGISGMKLSTEQSTRIMAQFQQMMSKGKVSAEDLNVVAESMPAPLKAIADAMGKSTFEVAKMMQEGKLLAIDVLPMLADHLHKTFGDVAVESANEGQGAINRFKNEIFETSAAIGKELLPAIGKLADEGGKYLRSLRANIDFAFHPIKNMSRSGWTNFEGAPVGMFASFNEWISGENIFSADSFRKFNENSRISMNFLQAMSRGPVLDPSEAARLQGMNDFALGAEERRNAERRKKEQADLAKLNQKKPTAGFNWVDTYRDLDTQLAKTNPALDEFDKRIEDVMNRIADLSGKKGADLTLLNSLRAGIITNIEAEREWKISQEQLAEEMKKDAEADKERQEIAEKGRQIMASLGGPVYKLQEDLQHLNDVFHQGGITFDEYIEAVARVEDSYFDLQEVLDKNQELQDQVGNSRITNPYEKELDALKRASDKKIALVEKEIAKVEKLKGKAGVNEEKRLEKELELNRQLELEKQAAAEETARLKREKVLDDISVVADTLDSIGQLLMQGNKKQFELGKKFAIASAIINAALAITRCYSELGPLLGTVAAVGIGAATMMQIDRIQAQEYNPSYAVGSPYIPYDQTANIHQGEMVIDRASADALRKYGIRVSGSGTADNYGDGAGYAASALYVLAASADSASLSVRKIANSFNRFKGSLDSIADLFGVNGAGKGFLPGMGEDAYARMPIFERMGRFFADMKMAGLGNSLFGWGNPWTVHDRGIKLEMLDGLIDGVGYTRLRKSGGLLGGPSYKTRESALDPKFLLELNDIMGRARSTISTATTTLGLDLGTMDADLAKKKFNFKGKSAEEAQQMIEDYLASAAEANIVKGLGGSWVTNPDAKDRKKNPLIWQESEDLVTLREAAKYGENLFDTLVRLSSSLQEMNETAELFGMTMVSSSIAGAKASDALIEQMGGLDKFRDLTQNYFEKFYDDDEQMRRRAEQAARQVEIAFRDMGAAVPATYEEFTAMVEALDLNTEAGREMFQSLMEISPAFETMQDGLEQLEDQVSEARAVYAELLQDELDGLAETRDTFDALARSLSKFRQSLLISDGTILSPEEVLGTTRDTFNSLATRARLGDADAMAELQDAASALLESSRGYYASGEGYVADFQLVQETLEAVEGVATRQSDNLTQQIETMQAQLDVLQNIEENTLTLARAMEEYNAAVAARGAGIPGFASGGYGSGWAVAGEYGRELINLGAGSRVYNAQETRQIFAPGADKETVTELKEQTRQLTAAVRVLQAGFQEMIKLNASQAADLSELRSKARMEVAA